MSKQDLYIGLGSLAYVVAKVDGKLHQEESQVLKKILQQEPHGGIAFYTFQLKETYNSDVEETYRFAMRRFTQNKKYLDAETKKEFIRILQQVADAYDGVSRKEKAMLKRCKRDIERI